MTDEVKTYAEEIRGRYADKSGPETKLEQLRRLDEAAQRPAKIFAFTFGVLGALVLGVGMCLAMEVIGSLPVLGIVIGTAGIAMVSANYPLYKAIRRSGRRKYAARILSLSDELLHEEK